MAFSTAEILSALEATQNDPSKAAARLREIRASGRAAGEEPQEKKNPPVRPDPSARPKAGGFSKVYALSREETRYTYESDKPMVIKIVENLDNGNLVHAWDGRAAKPLGFAHFSTYTLNDFKKEVKIATQMGDAGYGPEIFDAWYDTTITEHKPIEGFHDWEAYTTGPTYYIVMEDLSVGWSDWATSEHYPPQRILKVFERVVSLLNNHNVSHNDLHRQNIFWNNDDNKVLFIDWGQATEMVVDDEEKNDMYARAIWQVLSQTYLEGMRVPALTSLEGMEVFRKNILENELLRQDEKDDVMEILNKLPPI